MILPLIKLLSEATAPVKDLFKELNSYMADYNKCYVMSYVNNGMPSGMTFSTFKQLPFVSDVICLQQHCYLFHSKLEADKISDEIHNEYPNLLFFIAELIPSNCNGYCGQTIWNFIKEEKSKGDDFNAPKTLLTPIYDEAK